MSSFVMTRPNSTIDTHYKNRHLFQNDQDDIPYHAREYAKPFTYGNLPEGFITNELSHVEGQTQTLKNDSIKSELICLSSPLGLRKLTRPSITTSSPVLRKTPSREEFEKMLMERREQSACKQNKITTNVEQYPAIEKKMDTLQEKIMKSTNAKEVIEEEEKPHRNIRRNFFEKIPTAFKVPLPQRPETPDFPLEPTVVTNRCGSPYPLDPLAQSSSSILPKNERKNKIEPFLVKPHLVKYAKDSSQFWFKPHVTREEAVAFLRNATPGDFLVRNSTTYINSFGLVLRVSKPPTGATDKNISDEEELVRHFLIEANSLGVQLKGCVNEPLFTSLSAFVSEHSINRFALPCTLNIPYKETIQSPENIALIAAHKYIFTQGAACNVLLLFSYNTESLTGEAAVRNTVNKMYTEKQLPTPVKINFKVSQHGITLTDNTRTKFFRQFYDAKHISHIGFDPDNRVWSLTQLDEGLERIVNKTVFAFVARPMVCCRDNECHVFCDLTISQPASAIVSFARRVLPLDIKVHNML